MRVYYPTSCLIEASSLFVSDVNSELFPTRKEDKLTIALASTLALDGTPDDGLYNPNPGPSLMDTYDYVTHGRVFKISHEEKQNVEILASYGGLLMKMVGKQSYLDAVLPDMKLFMLIRKG